MKLACLVYGIYPHLCGNLQAVCGSSGSWAWRSLKMKRMMFEHGLLTGVQETEFFTHKVQGLKQVYSRCKKESEKVYSKDGKPRGKFTHWLHILKKVNT